ncbi:uncharacterized protein [Lolium perenne]|uniref:uncharacterized protein isoform X3 n=1 Tax=Lolium perenne TaxID=4522 RepID=UPI003A99F955
MDNFYTIKMQKELLKIQQIFLESLSVAYGTVVFQQNALIHTMGKYFRIPAPQLHCLSSYQFCALSPQGWMVLLVIFLACASTPWVSSIISSRHAIVSAGCALEALKLVSAYIISVSNYLPFATKTI